MTSTYSADYLRPPGGGGVAVLAHRGAPDGEDGRENTLTAFAAARRRGADGVELDVRLTADAALAVHHDKDVPGVGMIAELGRARLPDWVPLLADALAECAGLLVNVEIKLDRPEQASDTSTLARLVGAVRRAIADGPARATVSSFWPQPLALFGEAGDPPTGLLVHPRLPALAAVATATDLGCAALHPGVAAVSADLVAAAHDRGLAVVTWTVNRPDQVERVRAAGVDALITDHVEMALAALGRA